MRRGLLTVIRKDSDKGDRINNFKPPTLLNTDAKILMLAKGLPPVTDGLIEEAQGCAVPRQKHPGNVTLYRCFIAHLVMLYTLEGFGSTSGNWGTG